MRQGGGPLSTYSFTIGETALSGRSASGACCNAATSNLPFVLAAEFSVLQCRRFGQSGHQYIDRRAACASSKVEQRLVQFAQEKERDEGPEHWHAGDEEVVHRVGEGPDQDWQGDHDRHRVQHCGRAIGGSPE